MNTLHLCCKGTGHNKCVRSRTHLVWVGGGGGGGVGRGIKHTTYLVNITDKTLLALKSELKQKYSASKRQHCEIDKKSDD